MMAPTAEGLARQLDAARREMPGSTARRLRTLFAAGDAVALGRAAPCPVADDAELAAAWAEGVAMAERRRAEAARQDEGGGQWWLDF